MWRSCHNADSDPDSGGLELTSRFYVSIKLLGDADLAHLPPYF
jgi:hypothetical protein